MSAYFLLLSIRLVTSDEKPDRATHFLETVRTYGSPSLATPLPGSKTPLCERLLPLAEILVMAKPSLALAERVLGLADRLLPKDALLLAAPYG